MVVHLFVALSFSLAAAASGDDLAPKWEKTELMQLLARAEEAARLPPDAKDEALGNLAGHAYRVPRADRERVARYAERILRGREPGHPRVKNEQWLMALMRRLYDDVAVRAARVARFESNRRDRMFLDARGAEAANVARMLASELEVALDGVEGLDGFVEPPPILRGGALSNVGAIVVVRRGWISVEHLDRVHFESDRPLPNALRSSGGSLREVAKSLEEYNLRAEILSGYEPKRRRDIGNLRVVLPARAPSIYLNEIARAAIEAKMHTMHLVTLSPEGKVGALEVALRLAGSDAAKTTRRKRPSLVDTRCADELAVVDCVLRVEDAQRRGTVAYRVE